MPTIEGVYAAAVTPRRPGMQDINLAVMWDVIDFLADSGVDGIVLFGSTGEFVHYGSADRIRMVGLAPKRSRLPIIVNVSHSTLDGAVELAQSAEEAGAAAVLVMPPYFFRYDADDLTAFYQQFASEAEIDIPILLYHIPVFTNPVPFSLSERLLRDGTVQGVKDSSGNPDGYQRLANLRRETPFTYLMGSDSLFVRARRERGIDGVVSGIAAAVPELLVALHRAIGDESQEVVARLETRLGQFIEWAEQLAVPVCVREAAAVRGLEVGSHAIPPRGKRERTLCEFRDWFKPWLSEVQKECKHA
jgi:dihydrodipicolinate synthase/N-acetylneuraminate lyase